MRGHKNNSRSIGNLGRMTAVSISLITACGQAAAADIDLGIDNDAEYARLIDAMRAAEYLRTDVILAANGKPRIYASLAGLMAFAEINPNATDTDLGLFLQHFDQGLRAADPNDPDLNRAETFHAAIRFTRVDDAPFPGLDTTVGKRASELIDSFVPDPDGFESIQRRMVRYESALATGLNHNPDIFELLVAGFFGQDTAGIDRPGLPAILNAYFTAEGFGPALGSVRADLPEIDAGLAALPADYAAYQAAIELGAANDAFRLRVEGELGVLRDRLTTIIGEVNAAPLNDAIMSETLDLADTEVQDRIDALLESLRETAESRALTSAASFMMLQSQFDEIEGYGQYSLDFSSIQLQTNDTFTYLQESTSLVSNLTQVYLQYGEDPAAAAQAAFGAVEDVLDLFGIGFGGPSVDEQIFDQVVELRQQVEDMRVEMNERFDRIDQQLDIMYDTIVLGFDQIGDQIGDLQGDVDAIILDIATANSQLRRIEAALYGVAQDILLTDLTNEANVVLDYRDENGIDLPYSGGSPDFITASESFFTYATVTSLSDSFAGSRTNPTLNAGNADEFVGAGPVASYLNDLAVLPQAFGLPALVNSTVPGVEPWTQAASAYAQLARENPWYFNFRYRAQLDDFNADPQNESMPELDRIIRSGEQIVALVESIRETDTDGNSALFDALIQNYRDAADTLQDAIDARIVNITPAQLRNPSGSVALDFFGDDTQDIEAALEPATVLVTRNNGSTYTIGFEPGVIDKGYRMFTHPGGAGVEAIQIWALLQEADPSSNIRLRGEIDRSTSAFGQGFADVWLGGPGLTDIAHRRFNRFSGFFRLNQLFPWTPLLIDTEAKAEIVFVNGWVGSGLQSSFPIHRNTTPVGSSWQTNTGRADVTSEFTFNDKSFVRTRTQQSFYDYRSGLIYPTILADLLDPMSNIAIAAQGLNNAEALIDAYVSLGMPEELNDSDILRSALRAAPGTSEFGLRSLDAWFVIEEMLQADTPSGWSDPGFNPTQVSELLKNRIAVIENEIGLGLLRPATTPGYVGWILAELEHLRDTAFRHTVNDLYETASGSTLSVDAGAGLLANDVDQDFRVIEADPDFAPAAGGVITQPEGTLSFAPDGSFMFEPTPGFIGDAVFVYRSRTDITDVGQIVLSEPATVLIRVQQAPCPPDLSEPFGILNFFDVATYIGLYNAEDPAADLAVPFGSLNFFDVSAFISTYNAGCP